MQARSPCNGSLHCKPLQKANFKAGIPGNFNKTVLPRCKLDHLIVDYSTVNLSFKGHHHICSVTVHSHIHGTHIDLKSAATFYRGRHDLVK